MKFILYKDANGEFRWKIVARNNKVLADSGEGYEQKQKCVDSIHRLVTGLANVGAAVRIIDETLPPKVKKEPVQSAAPETPETTPPEHVQV